MDIERDPWFLILHPRAQYDLRRIMGRSSYKRHRSYRKRMATRPVYTWSRPEGRR